MIGKITKGADFDGLLKYLMRNGRGEIIATRHLASNTPADMADEMALTASLSARTKKPVMHISISYGPGETPDRSAMLADANAALKSLGLEHHQAAIVQHHDRDHTHFHIAVNRVGPDGKAAHDGKSYARLEAALRRIETDRGWSVVPGRNAPAPDGPRFAGQAKRQDPRQHTAPTEIRQALLTARSEVELTHQLQQHGWHHEVTRRPGKLPGLLLIGPDGQRIAASKIDRSASYSSLQRRWGRTPRKTPKVAGTRKRKSYRLKAHARKAGPQHYALRRTAQLMTQAFLSPLMISAPSIHRPRRSPRRRNLTRSYAERILR